MDTMTGKILFATVEEARAAHEKQNFIAMNVRPTTVQLLRSPPRVTRNEPCPCGSGRKLKHCHLGKKRD